SALVGDRRAPPLLRLADIESGRAGESAALELNEAALAEAVDPLVRARCYTMVAMSAASVDVPEPAVAARAALALLDGREDSEPQLVAAALGARVRADLFL